MKKTIFFVRNKIVRFRNWIAGYRCQKCMRISDISASLLVDRAMCNNCLSEYLSAPQPDEKGEE